MKSRLHLRLPLVLFALTLFLACNPKIEAQQAYSYGYRGQYQQQPAPGYAQPQYSPQPPQQGQQAYEQPQGAPLYAQPDPNSTPDAAPQAAPQQPLRTEELEQLVAPIALYPDTLVAQILAAATYPAQVVDADHWRQAQGNISPDQIVYGANAQSWDPSLKALTAFPQVLAEMDGNIRWTIALGNAYYNQPQDVLDVVQVMRQRAQDAGNLASNQQEVVNYNQGYIQVAPVNPDVVYLPAYDPWAVYGQPVQPYRGFSLFGALGSFFNSGFGSGLVRFGAGIAMNAFSHSPFGLLGWGLDWLTHSLLFHNSNYYSHSSTVADWGLPHGGPRAYGRNGMGERQLSAYRGPNSDQGRRQSSFARAPSPAFVLPVPRVAEPRLAQNPALQGGYRSSPALGNGFVRQENRFEPRPGMEAYNRLPMQTARPEQYGQGYGRFGVAPQPSSPYGAQRGGFAGRPAPTYAAPQQAYRAPAQSFERGDYGQRASRFSPGRGYEGYSGKEAKSGGFHGFGGGHEGKAPKAPKPPKMDKHAFGGGRSGGFGGGHSSGHGGGGHHR